MPKVTSSSSGSGPRPGPALETRASPVGGCQRSRSPSTGAGLVRGYHDPMSGRILNANAGNAVLDGGPLDGREHRVEPDAVELLVVMRTDPGISTSRARESRNCPMDKWCPSLSIGDGITHSVLLAAKPSTGPAVSRQRLRQPSLLREVFEHFTDRARRVLVLVQAEVRLVDQKLRWCRTRGRAPQQRRFGIGVSG